MAKKFVRRAKKVVAQKQTPVQVAGKFTGNERGFGFVLREGGEDIFIPPGATLGALHGLPN